jgi:glycopeptide antibiotics resistance protein
LIKLSQGNLIVAAKLKQQISFIRPSATFFCNYFIALPALRRRCGIRFYHSTSMFKQIAIPFFFLVVIAFTSFAIYRMIKPKAERYSKRRAIISLLFIWYLCAVAALTIVPIRESRTQNLANHFNFKPIITSYQRFWYVNKVHDGWGIENFRNNFFGNIIMFIPFGIFLPWLYRNKFWKVVFIAGLSSASIEFIQYLNMFAGYYRYVDVDDVILNTSGAIIGYWIYKVFFHARTYTRL